MQSCSRSFASRGVLCVRKLQRFGQVFPDAKTGLRWKPLEFFMARYTSRPTQTRRQTLTIRFQLPRGPCNDRNSDIQHASASAYCTWGNRKPVLLSWRGVPGEDRCGGSSVFVLERPSFFLPAETATIIYCARSTRTCLYGKRQIRESPILSIVQKGVNRG